MGFTAAGIQPTTVTNESAAGKDDASQLAPLGFEMTAPDGDNGLQTWIYVKAGEAIEKGDICIRKTTSQTYEVVLNPGDADVSAIRVVGVAQHDIGDNGYGFVMKKGIGVVQKDNAAINADDQSLICTDASTDHKGRACVDSGGGTSDVFAISLTQDANTAGGELITAHFNCIG